MTPAQLATLVVLTLLQLCRALPQTTQNQPDGWFSANIGDDVNYSRPPISELFSSVNPPTQPIIVVPSTTSSPLEYDDLSSVSVSTRQSVNEITQSISTFAPTQSTSASPIQFVSTSAQQPVQFFQNQGIAPQPPSIVFPDQTQPLLVNRPGVLVQNQTNFVNQLSTQSPQVVTNIASTTQTVRTPIVQSGTTVTIQPRPQSTPLSANPPVPTVVTRTKSVTVSNPSLLSFPVMKIQVRAPTGSRTNIRFVSSSTKRPPTTRTTRTPKVRNTYGSCINICGGRRDPICATPLSRQINADNLKGFPSMCHLACHNSYKTDRYEKVVDGKCGKLRTHIRTLGSKKKLKKEELQKTQYTIVQDNNAIVEFESLVQ